MFRFQIGMPDLSTKRAIAGWLVGIAVVGAYIYWSDRRFRYWLVAQMRRSE